VVAILGNLKPVTAPDIKASLSEVIWTEMALANLEAIRVYIEQL
jgi:hypothetical protein